MSNVYNSPLAKLLKKWNKKAFFAITLSSTCTHYSESKEFVLSRPDWIAHEEWPDGHQARIDKMGWINFMATWLWKNLTVGYEANDLETDAPKIK